MIFTSSCCDNLSIDEIIERAEKGDCEAQYIVGFYYNRDSAIDSPDDEKAFYWLKLAAEQGHCEAQYSLGQKYTEDKSRHKDNEQAIFWLKKAALQGHMNRPGFPGECFICELRLPDHRFRWKHNKLFLLLPEEYGPAFPAIVDCYTSPPT